MNKIDEKAIIMREHDRIRERVLKLRCLERIEGKIFNTTTIVEMVSREQVLAILHTDLPT